MKETVEIEVNPLEFSDGERLKRIAAKKAGINPEDVACLRLLRKSLDARKNPVYRLRFLVSTDYEEERPIERNYRDVSNADSVIIVGAGPCGLFAALTLLECGLKPVILERGRSVSERKKDIAMIARNVSFNEDSNWCFGEGGAGTFSDGKLYTRSNKKGSIEQVLETFVRHGADRSILTEAHPHIGTDRLSGIIKNIRHTITSCGGEYHFNSRVVDFIVRDGRVCGVRLASSETIEARAVILSAGHSARDVYELFHHRGWLLESKPFAMGVRVEHLQQMINRVQYNNSKYMSVLPPASYSLACNIGSRGVFSFCMCPGGMIIPSSTERNSLVVNGMSSSGRCSPFANSGIVVSVTEEDAAQYASYGALSLMKFQQQCEKTMYICNQTAPAQKISDFMNGRVSSRLNPSSYPSGLRSCNMNELLPDFVSASLKKGFALFDRKIKGFISSEAMLVGLESRTSSPVRIPRDGVTLQHPQLKNLYPCGEGAGYAGGITSSAMDGINTARRLAFNLSEKIDQL